MATEANVLDPAYRRNVLNEITSSENEYRKNESRRRFEVYNNNLHEIVKQEMALEYDLETIEKFRVQSSINLVPRVVNEQASIYKNSPKRKYSDLSEEQEEYVEEAYKLNKTDVSLKKTNKYYKLQDQVLLQVVPDKEGRIVNRTLQPHHYDVIPSEDDITKAMCVIVNLLREDRFISSFRDSTQRKQSRDFSDQEIGDWDDQKRFNSRFSWWTASFNFITDGFGTLVGDDTDIINSLEELPFIDVADFADKDFRYWIYKESLLNRFQVDFCKDLTDLTETIKMQGFAMGILFAKEKPESVNVGPRKFMFIPLDPDNPELRPSFEFKNPSPAIVAQMNVILDKLAMFLSSYGIDPKSVGGVANVADFNSGIQMLLSQIMRFEASNDDIQLFKWVEEQLYSKYVKWNNLLASEAVEGYVSLPDESTIMVKYDKPQMIETKREKEDRYIKLIENDLSTRVMAIMDIEEVGRDKAEEIVKEIDKERMGPQPIVEDENDDDSKS